MCCIILHIAEAPKSGPRQMRSYLAADATEIDSFFSKGSFNLLQLSHSGRRYQLLSVDPHFLHVSAVCRGVSFLLEMAYCLMCVGHSMT